MIAVDMRRSVVAQCAGVGVGSIAGNLGRLGKQRDRVGKGVGVAGALQQCLNLAAEFGGLCVIPKTIPTKNNRRRSRKYVRRQR